MLYHRKNLLCSSNKIHFQHQENIKENKYTERKREAHTYSAAYGDKQLAYCFGIIHHDRLDRSVQHFNLLWPLLLLVLQDIL